MKREAAIGQQLRMGEEMAKEGETVRRQLGQKDETALAGKLVPMLWQTPRCSQSDPSGL